MPLSVLRAYDGRATTPGPGWWIGRWLGFLLRVGEGCLGKLLLRGTTGLGREATLSLLDCTAGSSSYLSGGPPVTGV